MKRLAANAQGLLVGVLALVYALAPAAHHSLHLHDSSVAEAAEDCSATCRASSERIPVDKTPHDHDEEQCPFCAIGAAKFALLSGGAVVVAGATAEKVVEHFEQTPCLRQRLCILTRGPPGVVRV